MKHLSDDDLVLYHYGEIRTAPTAEHLSACPACRHRLDAFARDARTSPLRVPQRVLQLRIWRRLLLFLVPEGTGRRG